MAARMRRPRGQSGAMVREAARHGSRSRRRPGSGSRDAKLAGAVSLAASCLAAIYFGVSAYVAAKVSRPARNPPTRSPGDFGLEYEDVTFPSAEDNVPLSAWYVHASALRRDGRGRRVVVMVHGRDFSREANCGLEKAAALANHGYDVLMFDFRAHGRSGGKRFALGALETRDLAGALSYLQRRGVAEAGVYGISMGAATCLLAAVEHPEIKAVVCEAAYAELLPLIKGALAKSSGLPPFFNPGILLMARVLYGMDLAHANPAEALRTLGDRPVMLIHSVEDEFVPVADAYRLQQAGAANPNLSVWIEPTGEHCELFARQTEEYTRRMLEFYDKYLGPTRNQKGVQGSPAGRFAGVPQRSFSPPRLPSGR